MDDVYFSGVAILLLVIILRISMRLCSHYCQKTDGCKSKNSRRSQQAAANRERSNRQRSQNDEIFVIDLSDNGRELIEIEPPPYDNVIEDPPIYEEAIRLPPLESISENQLNPESQSN